MPTISGSAAMSPSGAARGTRKRTPPARFTFTTDLKAYESKELTAPLNTKLKIYELPDWQNVSTDVQITAPAAGSQ